MGVYPMLGIAGNRKETFIGADSSEEPVAKRPRSVRISSGIGAGVALGVALGAANGLPLCTGGYQAFSLAVSDDAGVASSFGPNSAICRAASASTPGT